MPMPSGEELLRKIKRAAIAALGFPKRTMLLPVRVSFGSGLHPYQSPIPWLLTN
jgi:hypothetical protein